MDGRTLRLGAFVPQGVNQEFAGLEPAEAWKRALAMGARAEELGYDALWVQDRVDTQPRREPKTVFDSWVMLSALAAGTSRPRLGNFVPAGPFHEAGVLAKQAATLDVASGGRMLLALDSGRHPSGYESFGWQRPGAAERAAALDEQVEALQRLWTEQRTTFEGDHVRLRAAHCFPAPEQGRVPVRMLAGAGGASADSVARLADAAVWQGSPEDVAAGRHALREACERLGRDPGSLTDAVMLECRLFDDLLERDRWLASPYVVAFWSAHPDNYCRRNLVGTPDAVAARLQRYVDAGAGELMVYFRDYPEAASLEAFITQVVPQVAAPLRDAEPQEPAGAVTADA